MLQKRNLYAKFYFNQFISFVHNKINIRKALWLGARKK